MKLLMLGTTGYHPNDQRQTACFMIPELGIVLDAGSAFYRTRKYLCTPELDVYISHAHLDHVFGITFLFDIMRDKDLRRVTVHAEQDKLAAIQDHLLAEPLFPVKPPCHFKPLAGAESIAGGGRLTHFPLEHPGGSTGFRLEWPGHSLAYVTDTTATPASPYIDAIRGVDLLIHECYFPDSMTDMAILTGHSTLTPVAEVARAAGVRRLVLVHVDPLSEGDDPLNLEAGRAIFPGIQLAHDFMEIEF